MNKMELRQPLPELWAEGRKIAVWPQCVGGRVMGWRGVVSMSADLLRAVACLFLGRSKFYHLQNTMLSYFVC